MTSSEKYCSFFPCAVAAIEYQLVAGHMHFSSLIYRLMNWGIHSAYTKWQFGHALSLQWNSLLWCHPRRVSDIIYPWWPELFRFGSFTRILTVSRNLVALLLHGRSVVPFLQLNSRTLFVCCPRWPLTRLINWTDTPVQSIEAVVISPPQNGGVPR